MADAEEPSDDSAIDPNGVFVVSLEPSSLTKAFEGLHERIFELQTSMEHRFDQLEHRIDNSPSADEKMPGSELSPWRSFAPQLTSSARRSRWSTTSGARKFASLQSAASDFEMPVSRRGGSLIWEATKLRRKAANRQSKIIMAQRQSVVNPTGFASEWAGSIRSCAQKLVLSPIVTQGVMLLVFVHVILLGIEVDVSAQQSKLEELPLWFSLVNAIIVSIFLLELVLKFVALGCSEFWCGAESGWNMFDFAIVAVSVVDVVVDYWSQTLSNSIVMDELRVFRSLRFVRAVRSIRIIRIFRYMAALRTLVLSIVSTMASLLWTLALLLVIIYGFSIILTQLVAEHCRFLMLSDGDQSICLGDSLRYWKSVPESMLTLFMTICQGIEWGDAFTPLRRVSAVAVGLVLLYVVFTMFAILNVVTGVFCQTAIESASNDKDVASMRQVRDKSQKIAQLKAIFKEMDRGNVNFVSFEDVKSAAGTAELNNFFESMGISTDDIWTWFMLLDVDQTGLVDLDAFVSGCMQLYGTAKSMQMAKMSYENKLLRDAVTDMRSHVMQEFRELKEQLGASPLSDEAPEERESF